MYISLEGGSSVGIGIGRGEGEGEKKWRDGRAFFVSREHEEKALREEKKMYVELWVLMARGMREKEGRVLELQSLMEGLGAEEGGVCGRKS